MNVESFRQKLIAWGREHFRPFPWRMTDDPYHILLAELMLHRTQARQVLPVYQTFITKYPNMLSLAKAPEKEIEEHFYQLGLHWRAKLVHQLALDVIEKYGGNVPSCKEELISLSGVSDYIASAVMCFAWNIPEILADTNTVRVVGRLHNFQTRDSSRRNTQFRKLISELVDPIEPRLFNYSLLDLADLICTERRPPAHDVCPVSRLCLHGQLEKRQLSKSFDKSRRGVTNAP